MRREAGCLCYFRLRADDTTLAAALASASPALDFLISVHVSSATKNHKNLVSGLWDTLEARKSSQKTEGRGLRLDFSRAGFGSAILQPRKARIYTEALARIET